jgi:hypothetical protein
MKKKNSLSPTKYFLWSEPGPRVPAGYLSATDFPYKLEKRRGMQIMAVGVIEEQSTVSWGLAQPVLGRQMASHPMPATHLLLGLGSSFPQPHEVLLGYTPLLGIIT